NKSNIKNPVAILSENITYKVTVSTEEGCFAMDTINIKVFKTAPDIFVPNAFTPTKESNYLFRPIPVGISSIDFFRVYNRWGQLVFSTSQIGKGWNGTVGGNLQNAGTYVWIVRGTDFTGKIVAKKGTMVLIR
ncbi:MAG TPA: gliding motility-associated C-terminal domain-containing protein, partial [Chitinophagaceae bacterium]|nr:gliding motility-associated C-terminal domain-containing protein [Chitinophagaceae bacterium]